MMMVSLTFSRVLELNLPEFIIEDLDRNHEELDLLNMKLNNNNLVLLKR